MRSHHIIHVRVCPRCGSAFTTVAGEQRYCGYTCSGAVNAAKGHVRPPQVRFWEKVNKTEGCWFWTAGRRGDYGSFGVARGNSVPAHRYSYQLAYGPIPDGLLVCHSCDANYPPGDMTYRLCVRPDHLFLGTHRENTHDAMRKGRLAAGERHASRIHPETTARGEQNGSAKLTEAGVREILRRPGESAAALARALGVCEATIRNIRRGKVWKHVRL